MDEERAAYLALALTPGIGVGRLRTLLDACQTAIGAHSAPIAFLCALPGISRAAATAIKAATPKAGADALRRVAALGATVLLPGDAEFPEALRQIPTPPTALFAIGDVSLLQRPAVALVGSRSHSAYGADVCRMIATTAAEAGIVVVSGMARGLDAVAHTAALDRNGGTIGVLGNGLGVIYPAANRSLYERVATSGLLLTEFPPGDRPHAGSFPRRNRLISGLARVTLVVEAAAGSGTLITVGAALEQGREVLAVPGNITSSVSVGTNQLIRDGATPYLEPNDLLQHYPMAAAPPAVAALTSPSPEACASLAPFPADLSADEQRLLAAIGVAAVHIDDLAERVTLPVSSILATLCTLELAGIVTQEPGRLFRHTFRTSR